MDRAEKIKLTDLHPILNDKVVTQSSGGHYFYQDIWAFKNILLDIDYGRIEFHVDVSIFQCLSDGPDSVITHIVFTLANRLWNILVIWNW